MKIIQSKQNTKEWREWRGKGLGASDAPTVMGESPWQTPFELWLEKTGLIERPPMNEFAVAAMKRGTDLEPKARVLFEKEMGHSFPSLSACHDEHEFLRASFDGYNSALNAIVEIKCPGKESHAKALKGQVPKNYYAQVQQQLLISQAKVCYYYSWDGVSDKGVKIEVFPDPSYQTKLLDNMIDFWARVQGKILPDVTSEDVAKLVKQQQKALETVNNIAKVLSLVSK